MTHPASRTGRLTAIEAELAAIRPMIGLFASDTDVQAMAALLDRQLGTDWMPTSIVPAVFASWLAEVKAPRAFPTPGALEAHIRAVHAAAKVDESQQPGGPRPPAFRQPRPTFLKALDEVWTELEVVSPPAKPLLSGLRARRRHARATGMTGPVWPPGHQDAGRRVPADVPHEHAGRARRGLTGCGDGCPAWAAMDVRRQAIAEVLAALPEPMAPSPGPCRSCPGDGWVATRDGGGCFPCPLCRRDQFLAWQTGGGGPDAA